MTVLITLTVYGSDTGPFFDLYSDVDGYVTPFEQGVAKADLIAGYTSSLVPDFATIVRVCSTGVCENCVNIAVTPSTTTTTSSTSTTTTTTTAVPEETTTTTTVAELPIQTMAIARPSGGNESYDLCQSGINEYPPVLEGSELTVYFYGLTTTPDDNVQLYTIGMIPFAPLAEYSDWGAALDGELTYSLYNMTITTGGIKTTHSACPGGETTTTTTIP